MEGLLYSGIRPRREPRTLVAHPLSQRLRYRLLTHFGVFAAVLTIAVLVASSLMARNMATQLVTNQMRHDVSAVVAQLPAFRIQRENLLLQFANRPELQGSDAIAQAQVIRSIIRSNPLYQQVLLVGSNGEVLASYPNAGAGATLTPAEISAVKDAVMTAAAQMSEAQQPGGPNAQHVVSVAVPIDNRGGRVQRVLVGRIPSVSLESLIVGLEGIVGAGSGSILDENGRIIADPDPTRLLMQSPITALRILSRSEDGIAFEGRNANTQVRELGFAQQEPGSGWQVVAIVPYDVVLRLALNIGVPLGLLMAVLTFAFSVSLFSLGHRFAAPVNRLVNATEAIAAGQLDTPIELDSNDEIGRLGESFEKMRRETRRRVQEMSLMVNVSQNLTRSLDSNEVLPAILRSALRASGAVGARVVIMLGGTPTAVGQGPAHESMARYDRPVADLLSYSHAPLFLTSADATRAQLLRNGNELVRFRSLAAFPLRSGETLLGVLWIGYRDEHDPDPSERALLNMLANQTTVVVENLRLYGIAEGGRRRLAAVLSSTVDPVLVIDEQQRVVMVNKSFEEAFRIVGRRVKNRPLTHALGEGPLRRAFLADTREVQTLELVAPDERVFEATVSFYAGPDDKGNGRVAVLRDISVAKKTQVETERFMQDAAHGFRTPLTSIYGYIEMVGMMGGVSDQQQYYLQRVNWLVGRMKEMVDDMVNLLKLDGGAPLAIGPIRPRWLIAEMKDTFAPQAESAGVILVDELEEDLPTFYADPSYIRRALECYVANAIKYAPNSGEVRMKVRRDGRTLVFGVVDQGPGIPRDLQENLFQRFYRAETPDNQDVKGHGLGLATVRSIAERHGGRAWCVSDPGVGSAFFFSVLIRPEQGLGSS